MLDGRNWDVTAGGRIEHVTDQETLPDVFQAALLKEDDISIVQFNRKSWPHTTSVVVRVTATRKKDAERLAQEILLPVFLGVAKGFLGDAPFGWTLSVNAKPVSGAKS